MTELLNRFEKLIFASRWILAPMYYALIGSLIVVVLKFAQEFWHVIHEFGSLDTHSMVVTVLQLVDVVLVGNLLVMIIFSGGDSGRVNCFKGGIGKIHANLKRFILLLGNFTTGDQQQNKNK
jgi:hypothetical protein